MIKFRTKYEAIYDSKKKFRPETICGSEIVVTYASKYDDEGHIVVYEDSRKNLQEYIDSFHDDCLLENMIDKYMNGDVNALDKVRGAYIDVSNMPNSMAELYNMVDDANKAFGNLPTEVRDAFNNNPVEFYQSYGSDSFNSIISSVLHIDSDSVSDIGNDEKEVIDNA